MVFCMSCDCKRGGKPWHPKVLAASMLLLGATASGGDSRVTLLPRLHSGETLQYESHGRVDRAVNTRSKVATIYGPRELRKDISAGLRLSVQEIHLVEKRPMMAAETELEEGEGAAGGNGAEAHAKVNFTIAGDGGVLRADGLDDLPAEQRLAWQFWVSQFAFGWTLPGTGVKPGEKWKTEEVEKTPSPIANLVWERETTYAQNEVCPVAAGEKCAVFVTSSTLKQKSNPKDATPEDYRLRQLKTTGFAKGTNETVAYLSLKTGLLMRATEDVKQSMDVTIAKADGSNQVRYQIEVNSHLVTSLVTGGDSGKSKDPR
jgi:hypothetical protein